MADCLPNYVARNRAGKIVKEQRGTSGVADCSCFWRRAWVGKASRAWRLEGLIFLHLRLFPNMR